MAGVVSCLATLTSLTAIGLEVLALSESENLLRVGFTDRTTPEDFARFVSRQLSADVRFCDGEKEIETVAVCSGAGSEFAKEIADLGIDAFVTGDAKYHDFLDAK